MLSNISPNTTKDLRRKERQRTLELKRAQEEKRAAREDLDNDVIASSSDSDLSDGYLSDVGYDKARIVPTRRKLRRHTALRDELAFPQPAPVELADLDNSFMQVWTDLTKEKFEQFKLWVNVIYLLAVYNGELMLKSAYNSIEENGNKFLKTLERFIPDVNSENAYEITGSQLTAFTFIVAILRITPRHIQQIKSLTDDATSKLQYIPFATVFAGISSIFTASILFVNRKPIQSGLSRLLNGVRYAFNTLNHEFSELFTFIKKRNGLSKVNNVSLLSSKLVPKDDDINNHPALIAFDDQQSLQLANLSRHRNRALFAFLTMGVVAYFSRLIGNSLDLNKPTLELIDSPINTVDYANNTCGINDAPKPFLSGLSYPTVSNIWDTYNAYAVQSGLWLSNQYNQYRSTHKASTFGETTHMEQAPVTVNPSKAVAVWFNPDRVFNVNNTSASEALSATVKATSNRTSYLPAWAEFEPTAAYDVAFGPEVAPVQSTATAATRTSYLPAWTEFEPTATYDVEFGPEVAPVQSTATAANRTSYLPAWTELEPTATYDVEFGPEVAPVQSTATAANRTSYLPAWTELAPTATYDVEFGPEFPASEAARIQAELTAQEQELRKAAELQEAIRKYALRGR